MNSKKPHKAPFFHPAYFLYDFGRITSVLPILIWLRPKWIYETRQAKKRLRGGGIVMANHASFADPVLDQLAVWYRRLHFVATKELFNGKYKSRLFRMFQCIPIDRENFNFDTFREITDRLNEGRVVTVYPEGHINVSENEIDAFKSGIVMMALRSGCPLVPLYTKKPPKIWKRAVFCIGEPLYLRDTYGPMPSMETIEEISRLLRDKELELKMLSEKER